MSDRLAVFNHGRIEQTGTPAEVYERPATEFVAGFVGVSNIIERDGLQIVRRRLLARYGDRADMVTTSLENHYRVEILLPRETG